MEVRSPVVSSVNLGRIQHLDVAGRRLETGFFKQPVVGRVDVGVNGLTGDAIADLGRHGGPDQAVYLFSAADAAWWQSQLGREVTPGYFGENLTLDGWWTDPRIGDRLHAGSLVLEISFPRVPCASLAARVGSPNFLKTFAAAGRPGAYARVLRPGSVGAGDRFEVERARLDHPSVQALFSLWHETPRDAERLRQALKSPLAQRARDAFEHWLDSAGRDSDT